MREVAGRTPDGLVAAVDVSPLSSAGLLADHFELVPQAADPDFLDRILEVCDAQRITDLVPTIDTELPYYAAARDRFAQRGVRLWVSSPDVVRLGMDKWAFHTWLTSHGLQSPRTFEAVRLLGEDLRGPVIAKPRGGSSSVGLLRFDSVEAALRASLPEDYIVQEVAPGDEVTVDFAVGTTGDLLGVGLRRRLEVRAGEVSKAVTVDDPRLVASIEDFVATLPPAFGVLNVQLFVTPDRVSFLELNPRFGGGFPLTWAAGARLPELVLDGGPRIDARSGVVMLRYDDAVFTDLTALPGAAP